MQDFRELLPTELKEEVLAYRCDYRITVDYFWGHESFNDAFEVNLVYPSLVVAFEIKSNVIPDYIPKLASLHRQRAWFVNTRFGGNSFIERIDDNLIIARKGYVTATVLYCSDIVKALKIIAEHPLNKELHIKL